MAAEPILDREAATQVPADPAPSIGRRLAIGVAPAVFAAALAIRAVRPVFDPTLFVILLALVAVTIGMIAGRRWAAIAFVAFPMALVFSPSGNELSFSLSADDSAAWRWHALVGLLSAGVALGSAAVVAIRRSDLGSMGSLLAGGALVGVGFVALVQALFPHPSFGSSLSTAERAELPRQALVNFAFAPLEIQVPRGGVYRSVLVNPSDLPHTVTIDELDLEVYVPAHREAVLEIDGSDLDGPTAYYCSIGEHRDDGMEGVVVVTGP